MNYKSISFIYLLVAGLILAPAAFSFGQTSTPNENGGQLALTQNKEKVNKAESIIEQIQKSLEKLFIAQEENELTNEKTHQLIFLSLGF